MFLGMNGGLSFNKTEKSSTVLNQAGASLGGAKGISFGIDGSLKKI